MLKLKKAKKFKIVLSHNNKEGKCCDIANYNTHSFHG